MAGEYQTASQRGAAACRLTEDNAVVTPEMLSPELVGPPTSPQGENLTVGQIAIDLDQPLARAVATLEREMLARALNECAGQVTDAARKLGLSRKGLYLKRRRLGLGPELSRRTGSASFQTGNR